MALFHRHSSRRPMLYFHWFFLRFSHHTLSLSSLSLSLSLERWMCLETTSCFDDRPDLHHYSTHISFHFFASFLCRLFLCPAAETDFFPVVDFCTEQVCRKFLLLCISLFLHFFYFFLIFKKFEKIWKNFRKIFEKFFEIFLKTFLNFFENFLKTFF